MARGLGVPIVRSLSRRRHLQAAALNDGPVEEPGSQRRGHHRQNIGSPRRLAKDRHIPRIAPERCNVVAHPAQGGDYVQGAVEIVRSAQQRVAAEDDLIEIVGTDDLSKDPDLVHYDGAGLIELGYRFARSQVLIEERSRGVLKWLDDLFRFFGRPAPF